MLGELTVDSRDDHDFIAVGNSTAGLRMKAFELRRNKREISKGDLEKLGVFMFFPPVRAIKLWFLNRKACSFHTVYPAHL